MKTLNAWVNESKESDMINIGDKIYTSYGDMVVVDKPKGKQYAIVELYLKGKKVSDNTLFSYDTLSNPHYNKDIRIEKSMTLDSIDDAMVSDYIDDTTRKMLNNAVKLGYITQLSHTQYQWTEDGFKKAKKELK